MSADDLGRRLLAEIEEENLSEIIASLTASSDISGQVIYTGIERLDRLITLFHTSRQTFTGRRRQQPCIEITSPGTDDGKTELLYYLIALAILPRTAQDVPLGGQQGAVVFFDCDGTFSVTRLVTVIRNHLSTVHGDIGEAELSRTIEHALQHLHILAPQSMASFIRMIEGLSAYLYDDGRHYSMHRCVHSIMVDSATAFYWADRNDTETANVPVTVEDATDSTRPKAHSGYSRLRAGLQHLSQELSCAIVYTAGNLFAKPSPGYTVESSLPKSWLSFPTVRLLVRREEVRGLPPAICAEEAVRDARDRNEAVSRGLFALVINEAHSEEWSTEVRDEMVRSGNRRLTVRVTAEGVAVE